MTRKDNKMGRSLTLSLWIALLVTVMFGFMTSADAQRRDLGILNQKAPSLGISEWFYLPEGKTTIDIGDVKGKVVYLYCFQSW